MNKKFLIITEGSVTEPTIFVNIFKKYGFTVEEKGQIKVDIDNANVDIFGKYEISNNRNDIVVVAQGPGNRIRDLLLLYDSKKYDIEKFFTNTREYFAGVFLLYDVDQTINAILDAAFSKFNNEQDGLMLVSSPCIEVLAHEDAMNIQEVKGTHLSSAYKSKINTYINDTYHLSSKDYMYSNFEKLALKYLELNCKEFDSLNVMEHPQLIINKVNKLNIRELKDNNEVEFCYRYFSTVVYVCVAHILGLTKEIENAQLLRDFLQKFI